MKGFPEDTHYCITCEKTGCGSGIAHCSMSAPEQIGKPFRSRCNGMFVKMVPIQEELRTPTPEAHR